MMRVETKSMVISLAVPSGWCPRPWQPWARLPADAVTGRHVIDVTPACGTGDDAVAAPADRDTNPCRARQDLRNRPSRTPALPAENCRRAAPPAGAVTGTGCATRCPSGTTGVLDGPGGPWCLPPACPVPPRPAPAGAHLAERRHVVLLASARLNAGIT